MIGTAATCGSADRRRISSLHAEHSAMIIDDEHPYIYEPPPTPSEADIESMLASLTDDNRAVVLLLIDGFTWKDVMEELGVNMPRILRALRAWGTLLKERGFYRPMLE
jgi:DNA-directed RNA polymerase specialized sigma24 family protein